VIIAKTEEVQVFLKKQFKAREVHKTYVAVILGQPKLDMARIDLPLLRNLKRPTTFLVNANGKPAETFYKVLQTNGELSMVELKPTTGRTHQLRVHMQYLGHPILGDRVYGDLEKNRELFKSLPQRMYLHAEKLEITLLSGKSKTFTAPIPQEFKDVF
jgi:RluA family pseudouridine synthase